VTYDQRVPAVTSNNQGTAITSWRAADGAV
jgi:hypothetical protein